MAESTENVIEFLNGQRTCVVTLNNGSHIRKLKKLYEEHKEDFKYFHENSDGSVCAKIPLKWIRFSIGRGKRELTDEQREELRERMAKARASARKK